MKLITDQRVLSDTFASLCERYDHFKWAVAWAGKEERFNLASLLEKNIEKVDRLVVGLHFYQTDPGFISHYMWRPSVRFIKQTEGIFHSKVYFFFNSLDDWSAIVGSSNFTRAGFSSNSEANIYFDHADGKELSSQLNLYIESLWENASPFSDSELASYKTLCDYQKSTMDSLRKSITKNNRMVIDSSVIDVMTWDSYVKTIFNNESLYARISLLDKAHELFRKYKRFNRIPYEYRACLAGIVQTMPGFDDAVDWRLFGSMRRATKYTNAIKDRTKLAEAIDIIPLYGEISEETFMQYYRVFKRSFKNPLASATRLLAIKRPDVFVCIDSKNKRGISEAFNIPLSRLTFENYWECIVERIRDSVWYSEKTKGRANEKRIKKYQVALLDCFYYVR